MRNVRASSTARDRAGSNSPVHRAYRAGRSCRRVRPAAPGIELLLRRLGKAHALRPFISDGDHRLGKIGRTEFRIDRRTVTMVRAAATSSVSRLTLRTEQDRQAALLACISRATASGWTAWRRRAPWCSIDVRAISLRRRQSQRPPAPSGTISAPRWPQGLAQLGRFVARGDEAQIDQRN